MKTNTNHPYILGIDISKKTLDLCLTNDNQPIYQDKITNTAKSLKQLKKKLKSLKINSKSLLICCENTGLYTTPLLGFTEKNKLNLWLETPLNINKSQGFTRGKSDKVDAQRIASYAYRYQDKCEVWTPLDKSISALKILWKHRKSLVKAKTQINQTLNEIKDMQGQTAYNQACKVYKNTLDGIEKDIKKIEKDIKSHISFHKELQNLHEIITSVDGVGTITAQYLMVVTHGFEQLNDPRKLACYAGVAPFPYSSGTSIRGKEKVSPFANKELKTLLHTCAVSLLKMKNTFSVYIERKKKEGKHIMSIVNALKNKLLCTICACVRKNEKYKKNHVNSLA